MTSTSSKPLFSPANSCMLGEAEYLNRLQYGILRLAHLLYEVKADGSYGTMRITGPDRKAVVLVSGGLDSATALAIAKAAGFEIYAISFDYGQSIDLNWSQLDASANRRCERASGMQSDTGIFRGSALTNDIPVPHNRDESQMSAGIPVTYVPARIRSSCRSDLGLRNPLVPMTSSLASMPSTTAAIRIAALSSSRPLSRWRIFATKAAVDGRRLRIQTPLIRMTKAEIIRQGLALGVDYSLTHSCYDPLPDGTSCGECDSCQLRLKGFREAGALIQFPISGQPSRSRDLSAAFLLSRRSVSWDPHISETSFGTREEHPPKERRDNSTEFSGLATPALAVLNRHGRANSTSRSKGSLDFHPAWQRGSYQVIQNHVGDSFIIGTMIPVLLQVQLQRLQFETDFVSHIRNRQRAKIRLPRFWTHRREFRRNGFDEKVSLRKWILKCLQEIARRVRHR